MPAFRRQSARATVVALGLALASAPTTLRAQGDSTASPAYHRRAARASYAAKDYAAYRQHVRALYAVAPYSPQVVYAMARAEALNGDADAAVRWLGRYADLGLVADVAADSDLMAARGSAAFTTVAGRLAANAKLVSRSDTAFALAETDLLPEDIAYYPAARTFYLSSLRKRKIVAVDARGRARDFVRSGAHGLWAVSALALDPARRVLWASTAATVVQEGYAAADSGRSAVLQFDLATGKLLRRVEPPSTPSAPRAAHFFGDMTVDAGGNVLVSDAVSPAVYVIRAGSAVMELVVGSDVVGGPQAPAVLPGGDRVFVADYPRGILVTDRQGRAPRWLAHSDSLALTGIDGLSAYGTSLIAVQNGTNPVRVLRLELDERRERVTRWSVLEANNPVLREPTHGVVVGDVFYYIANNQAFHFQATGRLPDGVTLDPPVVLRIPLR